MNAKIPKCLWVQYMYCWQRSYHESKVFEGKVEVWQIDDKKCAACIAARMNYGDRAIHQLLTKDEAYREQKGEDVAR